jgi:hypothetical protein
LPNTRHFHLASVGSTLSEAWSMVGQGEAVPFWLTADEQTQGRGRMDRHWVSKPGNLYSTYVTPPPADLQLLPFAVSLAVYQAIAKGLPDDRRAAISLKWPNDVLIDGAKTSGILIEQKTQLGQAPLIAIGIGINVEHAPDIPGRAVTHLAEQGAIATPGEVFLMSARNPFWNARAIAAYAPGHHPGLDPARNRDRVADISADGRGNPARNLRPSGNGRCVDGTAGVRRHARHPHRRYRHQAPISRQSRAPGRKQRAIMSKAPSFTFMPLGGVGEIGMNLALYGYGSGKGRRFIMVDCGVSFAGPDLPGIDLITPDISYIEKRRDKLDGIIITHAHEDHIGALLTLWPHLQAPVYISRFAEALLEAKNPSDQVAQGDPLQTL